MTRTRLWLAALALLFSAAPTSFAQTGSQIAVDWDLAFDSRGDPLETSTPPLLAVPGEDWTATGPALAIDHPEAFAVGTADFDNDGYPDVVTAGILSVGDALVGHEELGEATAKITYMRWSHGGWAPKSKESLYPSSASYNTRLGDVNNDGFVDILLTRRIGATSPSDTSKWDALFLNKDRSVVGAPRFRNYVHVRPYAESTPGVIDAHYRQTFGAGLFDADLDGELEVVTSGWYGLRYYDLNPDALDVSRLVESDAPNEIPFETVYSEPFAFDNDDLSLFAGPGGAPIPGSSDGDVFTQFAFGDVDGDSDIDLVAPHNRQGALPPLDEKDPVNVYFNSLCDDGDCENGFEVGRGGQPEPFRVANLADPENTVFSPDPPSVMNWVEGANCNPNISYVPGNERVSQLPRITFEVALGDLDGDDDLDLVLANVGAKNTAYLNNGAGSFGSSNLDTDPPIENDGEPAYTFESATWDWSGTSRSLDVISTVDPHIFQGQTFQQELLPVAEDPGPECRWHHAWPGEGFDHTTGVNMFDVDQDGRVDYVGFSNRADWADAALTSLAVISDRPAVFPGWHLLSKEERDEYLLIFSDDPEGNPTSRFTDHVYFNESVTTPPGESAIRFADHVELIGGHTDGTAYGEFQAWMMPRVTPNPGGPDHTTLVDTDFSFLPFDFSSAPAWLDANFENTGVSFFIDWPDGSTPGGNHVLWGQAAQLANLDHIAEWVDVTDGAETITVDIKLMLTEALGVYNMASQAPSASSAAPSLVLEPGPAQLGWIALVSRTAQYPEAPGSEFAAAGWRLRPAPGTSIGFLSADDVVVHDELSRAHDGSVSTRGTHPLSGVFTLPKFDEADPTQPFIVDISPRLRRTELKSAVGGNMTDGVSDGDELYIAVAVFDGPITNPSVLWISNSVRVPLELPVFDG